MEYWSRLFAKFNKNPSSINGDTAADTHTNKHTNTHTNTQKHTEGKDNSPGNPFGARLTTFMYVPYMHYNLL